MADAEKVEKVVNGLEHCLSRYVDGLCDGCSYMGQLDKSYMIPMKCKEIIMRDALSVIRELKAENEQLKYEKEKAIRDIGLYIADAEEDARTPSRIGKGYYVGEQHGLQIAKEIVEGIRNHG